MVLSCRNRLWMVSWGGFRGGGFGLWGDLITGIIGAYVGGFLFNMMGISAYGMIGSIVVSTIGAVVFLWVLRMFTRNKTAA